MYLNMISLKKQMKNEEKWRKMSVSLSIIIYMVFKTIKEVETKKDKTIKRLKKEIDLNDVSFIKQHNEFYVNLYLIISFIFVLF